MDDKCPVCGKEYYWIDEGGRYQTESHLDCVRTMNAVYTATYKMEHENLQRAEQAEAEVARLTRQREADASLVQQVCLDRTAALAEVERMRIDLDSYIALYGPLPEEAHRSDDRPAGIRQWEKERGGAP